MSGPHTEDPSLPEWPADPEECEHGRWNPDNRQCLDCGEKDEETEKLIERHQSKK